MQVLGSFWLRFSTYAPLSYANREVEKALAAYGAGDAASSAKTEPGRPSGRQERSGNQKRQVEVHASVSRSRPAIAFAVLRTLLLEGTLRSFVTDEHGRFCELPAAFWEANDSIETVERSRLTAVGTEYEFKGKIVVSREQLSILVKLASDAALSRSELKKSGDRGGAPRKYDIEAFLIEAFRIIYDTTMPMPETSADLRKRVSDAYAELGLGTPSEDWAREKINIGCGTR
jgi:hypothetical protein